MALKLLICVAFMACTSAPLVGDSYVGASTPIVVEGKWSANREVCAVAITHDRRTVVFYSRRGCAVVHREVAPPTLLEQRARAWRPQ